MRVLFVFVVSSVAAFAGTMPVSQQNQLVAKYCGVCHSDARPNGGISLEHFDAARPDAGMVAMMVSKFKGNAFGASGQPLPDKATQQSLVDALEAESAGASEWIVSHANRPASFSVGITREIAKKNGEPNLYRLTVTCRADSGKGEMQIAWSPDVPKEGSAMSVSADRDRATQYTVGGKETMGNGQAGTSGPGAWIIDSGRLPKESLRIGGLFGDETVEFPFGGLSAENRKSLSACFE